MPTLCALRYVSHEPPPIPPRLRPPIPRPLARARARPRASPPRPAARATLAGCDPAGEPPPGPPGRADAPGGGAPPSSPAADRRGLLARRPARAVAFESEVLDLSSGARAPLRPDLSTARDRAAAAFPPASPGAMPPSPLGGGAPGGASPGGPGSAGGVPWEYRAPWLYRRLDRRANRGRGLSLRASRSLVLALTFACYACYHASRKPPSIVKSVLHGGAGAAVTGSFGADVLAGEELPGSPESFADAVGRGLLERGGGRYAAAVKAAAGPAPPSTSSGWAPFDSLARGKALLGDLDLAFLGSYAAGMFVAGHLGDRVDLRRLLTWGMVGSGLAACAFGAAFFLDIHNMGYFLFVSVSVAAA